MDLNRRNVLVAVGTIAAGSGTALATGAFTNISADRTVTITTASDSEAVVSLFVDKEGEYTGLNDGGSGDVIELDFTELNQDAVTTFSGGLTIENNGSQTVRIEIDSGDDVLVFSNVPNELEPDQTERVTLIVDLKQYESGDAPEEITISATRTD